MPLYTRTGDAGETSLLDGSRVSKHSPRVEAYGTVDELNAHIGLLIAQLSDQADTLPLLSRVQNDLFTIGTVLSSPTPLTLPLTHEHLERAIDALEQPWRGFTLPGGHVAAAQSHVCRTVCRRAERLVSALMTCDSTLSAVLTYLNRLSDYFYALALHINRRAGVSETYYTKNA